MTEMVQNSLVFSFHPNTLRPATKRKGRGPKTPAFSCAIKLLVLVIRTNGLAGIVAHPATGVFHNHTGVTALVQSHNVPIDGVARCREPKIDTISAVCGNQITSCRTCAVNVVPASR